MDEKADSIIQLKKEAFFEKQKANEVKEVKVTEVT